jgi:hypothetical protein
MAHNHFAAVAGRIALFSLLAVFGAGCTKKPSPPPKIADLHFPVAVLYSNSSTVSYKDAADLGVMHMNLIIMTDQRPALIDSNFEIYTLDHLRSTHGGLWLMAHPSGTTEVEFTLTRAAKTGLEAARNAMRAQLDMQTWRDDLEKRRAALAKQTTLNGMLDVLRSDDMADGK